jgi:hypothetical protein
MILTTLTPVKYPIHTGNREVFVGIGNGPASYNQTTGDVLSVASSPFFIDAVLGLAVTTDGTYIGVPVPIATGNGQGWTIFWYAFATSGGATPAWTALGSGASIATKQVQLTVIGGA